jgi:hypothetical protein
MIPTPAVFTKDLGITGDQLDACSVGCLAYRLNDTPERFHWQPLFKDEAGAQIGRSCAAHRQVVDGTIDCQTSYVTTREKEGVDNIRIGGEGEPRSPKQKNGAVVPRLQQRIAEGGHEHLLDQLVHQLPATPVRQHDIGVLLNWDRA